MTSAAEKGRAAEEVALDYLRAKGLELVESNYRCRLGEIDLILKDDDELVVAEVRLRSSGHFGTPAETITGRKRNRIIRATLHFISTRPEFRDAPVRFDVVAIDRRAGQLRSEWIRDAFRADDTMSDW